MSHELTVDSLPLLVTGKVASAVNVGDVTFINPPAIVRGGIGFDGTTLTLPAGHTYLVKAHLRTASNVNVTEQFVDPANLGVGPVQSTVNAGHSRTITAVVTGPAQVKLRTTASTANHTNVDESWLEVRALN